MSRSPVRRSPVLLALAAAILVIATGASPAAAAIHTGDRVLVTTSVFAPKYADVGGRVDCPPGHVVISGGASWVVGSEPQTAPQAKNRYLDASRPIDGGTAWYAVGTNLNDDATFRIAAWCLPADQVGPYVTRKRALPFTGKPSGSVGCPSGQRAVIGGASLQEDGEPLTAGIAPNGLLSSLLMRSDQRGWQASALLNSSSRAKLRLIVLCRPDAAVGTYQRHVEVATFGQTRGRVAFCLDGAGVMGGGAGWQTTAGAFIGGIGVLSSSSPDVSYGGEWFATGRNRWTGKDVQLRVVTVCRPA